MIVIWYTREEGVQDIFTKGAMACVLKIDLVYLIV